MLRFIKKFISLLLIWSFIFPDLAMCMAEEEAVFSAASDSVHVRPYLTEFEEEIQQLRQRNDGQPDHQADALVDRVSILTGIGEAIWERLTLKKTTSQKVFLAAGALAGEALVYPTYHVFSRMTAAILERFVEGVPYGAFSTGVGAWSAALAGFIFPLVGMDIIQYFQKKGYDDPRLYTSITCSTSFIKNALKVLLSVGSLTMAGIVLERSTAVTQTHTYPEGMQWKWAAPFYAGLFLSAFKAEMDSVDWLILKWVQSRTENVSDQRRAWMADIASGFRLFAKGGASIHQILARIRSPQDMINVWIARDHEIGNIRNIERSEDISKVRQALFILTCFMTAYAVFGEGIYINSAAEDMEYQYALSPHTAQAIKGVGMGLGIPAVCVSIICGMYRAVSDRYSSPIQDHPFVRACALIFACVWAFEVTSLVIYPTLPFDPLTEEDWSYTVQLSCIIPISFLVWGALTRISFSLLKRLGTGIDLARGKQVTDGRRDKKLFKEAHAVISHLHPHAAKQLFPTMERLNTQSGFWRRVKGLLGFPGKPTLQSAEESEMTRSLLSDGSSAAFIIEGSTHSQSDGTFAAVGYSDPESPYGAADEHSGADKD